MQTSILTLSRQQFVLVQAAFRCTLVLYRCDHAVIMQNPSYHEPCVMHVKWKQFQQSQMQIWLESEFCVFRNTENVRKFLPLLSLICVRNWVKNFQTLILYESTGKISKFSIFFRYIAFDSWRIQTLRSVQSLFQIRYSLKCIYLFTKYTINQLVDKYIYQSLQSLPFSKQILWYQNTFKEQIFRIIL